VRRLIVVAFVLVMTAPSALPGPPSAKDQGAAARVRARLRGSWRELPADHLKGKPVDPLGGVTWEIFPDYAPDLARLTDWDNEAQQWGGDAVLNTEPDPMWLDLRFRDNDKDYVQVGIFKFDGDRLLWARGKWVDAKAYDRAKGVMAERPKGFTTPEGRPLYSVFERIRP
jgi:uncharacterized protein (TIGR03067 family)